MAAPPADVLGRFGVLARPATIADQVPVLNTLGLDLAGVLGSYDSGYIRFLATLPANRQLFLIPGSPAKLALPPPSCLPAKARGPLEQIMDDQAKRARDPVFCLAVIGSRSASVGAPSACFPFALEPNGYAIASVGQNTIGNPSRTLAGLVPDGVSSVALSFSRAPRLTAATSNNTFVVRGAFRYLDALERREAVAEQHSYTPIPQHAASLLARRFLLLQRRIIAAAAPTHVRWLGPDGRIIATFTPPSSTLAAQEIGALGSFSVSSGLGMSSVSLGVGFTAPS